MMDESQPPPPSISVRTIQKLGPTHARGLRRLVGISSNIRQGEPIDDMRLDFDLGCGIAPLRINDRNFELGLRTCFVSLDLQNCEVLPGSRYEHRLDIGAFKASEINKTTISRARGAGAGINVEADSTRGLAALAVKLGLGVFRKRNAESETITEQSVRVELVVLSGQDRWRIGDLTRGDARRPDGLLSGAYFLEERSKDGDTSPLCRLKWLDHTASMIATISVTASFGSLLIFHSNQSGAQTENVDDDTRTKLKRESKRAESDHESLLRAHVAGLVAAKQIRNAQKRVNNDVFQNEFLIVRQTVLASPQDVSPVAKDDCSPPADDDK